MADEIKAGDVVQLKSGGPKMSVQKMGTYPGIGQGANCVWFDGSKESMKVFAIAVLKKVE
ncbi:DUF2158 domain-containing protein [Bradyrhizobium sp. Ash2021]|uniref:YodC family protein n=1 Tax=Bradyrhizobium sp. Ash2021 TaxID=2954771 RepID=UPI00281517F0|nr:DUF2158 domain-containing protein [Bradyrhizobium sp. Ash2021]WMT71135.1 YodC family protein [Bradyrhizobium sp. Ash2021]